MADIRVGGVYSWCVPRAAPLVRTRVQVLETNILRARVDALRVRLLEPRGGDPAAVLGEGHELVVDVREIEAPWDDVADVEAGRRRADDLVSESAARYEAAYPGRTPSPQYEVRVHARHLLEMLDALEEARHRPARSA